MSIFKFVEKLFDVTKVSPEHASHIRGEQIEAFKRVLPFGVVATALNALVVFVLSLIHI